MNDIKRKAILQGAAALFATGERNPERISELLGKTVSARTLQRWRAEDLDGWRALLSDLEYTGDDHFSIGTGAKRGRKTDDGYDRAVDALNQMSENLTDRQRVKLLKSLMPGWYRTTYSSWVRRWNSKREGADTTGEDNNGATA